MRILLQNKNHIEYMNKNTVVGIWGFGIVGQAALRFFTQRHYQSIIILESGTIAPDLYTQYAPNTIITVLHDPTQREIFLKKCDVILASAGIDTRLYRSSFNGIWLNELDIFQALWHKKIIAVTGTVGKTTVTHLLSQLLASTTQIATGGNIGTACFDLLSKQKYCNAAILEVSSFQLEFVQSFAPDLAIFTTFAENHLDRHSSMDEYFKAKYGIIAHQRADQKALLPASCLPYLNQTNHSRSALFLHATTRQEADGIDAMHAISQSRYHNADCFTESIATNHFCTKLAYNFCIITLIEYFICTS